MAKTDFKSVDEYIATHPKGVQAILRRVRSTIRKAVPGAEEMISYQIPAYKLPSGPVLYFAGWSQHYSLYPATDRLVAAFKDDLAPYKVNKGTIRFPLSQPVPVKLIERIAKLRAKEAAERARAKRAEPKKRRKAASRPGKTGEKVAKSLPAHSSASSPPSHTPTRGLYGWITHTDFASADPAATKAWCAKVLGWAFKPSFPTPAGEYHLFAYSDKGGGGIRPNNPPEAPGSMPFVHVADVRASFAKALREGAAEMSPHGEGHGRCVRRDREGAGRGCDRPLGSKRAERRSVLIPDLLT